MYLTGGLYTERLERFDEEGPMSEVRIFDIAMNKWTVTNELNKARADHSSVCLGQHVYVFEGSTYERGCISLPIERLLAGSKEPWKIV